MVDILDCRGLACPEPVLRCKTKIEEDAPQGLKVIVDNEAAKENVKRFITSKGYIVESIQHIEGNFEIIARAGGEVKTGETEGKEEDLSLYSCNIPSTQKIVVFITASTLGRGDEELGKKLMENFIKTLPELGKDLWRIIMVNSAVELATREGPCLDALRSLEKEGVSILVCGTCLDFFGLLDKKQVGETTNMLDVVTSLQLASKIIRV